MFEAGAVVGEFVGILMIVGMETGMGGVRWVD